MRNRAKCKLCNEILESFHQHDYVSCKCEEIAIDGGQSYFRAFAKDWANFLRVDDEGREIEVRVVDKDEEATNKEISCRNDSRDDCHNDHLESIQSDLFTTILNKIEYMKNLPNHAMNATATNRDIYDIYCLLSEFFKNS